MSVKAASVKDSGLGGGQRRRRRRRRPEPGVQNGVGARQAPDPNPRWERPDSDRSGNHLTGVWWAGPRAGAPRAYWAPGGMLSGTPGVPGGRTTVTRSCRNILTTYRPDSVKMLSECWECGLNGGQVDPERPNDRLEYQWGVYSSDAHADILPYFGELS